MVRSMPRSLAGAAVALPFMDAMVAASLKLADSFPEHPQGATVLSQAAGIVGDDPSY
mgnify:CR=1 FL=1